VEGINNRIFLPVKERGVEEMNCEHKRFKEFTHTTNTLVVAKISCLYCGKVFAEWTPDKSRSEYYRIRKELLEKELITHYELVMEPSDKTITK
jgi:hypothetical protein